LIKELNINMKQLELSIYLRYWHAVDYPEIWEYMILFLDKYIKEWYSKYLSWIRLLPIKENVFPRSWFFKKNKIIKYNVKKVKFEIALKKYAIPFHLSHSGFKNTESLPYITSWWMDEDENIDQIDLWLELEEFFDGVWIDRKTIDEISKQVIVVIQELDEKLDKKVASI
jgi:hypothetical protein